MTTDYYVNRLEKRQVVMNNEFGEARFLDGTLWMLDLGPEPGKRGALPLPKNVEVTAERLTGYIEFLRTVRAEVRRLKDGAQETNE